MIFKELCTFFDKALVLEAAIRPEPGASPGMNTPARSTSMHLGSVDRESFSTWQTGKQPSVVDNNMN
jgi:hypothetical protein